jgi:hypothetical protein
MFPFVKFQQAIACSGSSSNFANLETLTNIDGFPTDDSLATCSIHYALS